MLKDGIRIPCPRCAAGRACWRRYRYKGIPVTVCLICGFDGKRRRPSRDDLQIDSLRPVGFGAYRRGKNQLLNAPALYQ